MNNALVFLIALVLILSPWLAALPDDTVSGQSLWASWISALVMAAAVLDAARVWRRTPEAPRTPASSGGDSHVTLALLTLLGLAALSLVWRLVAQRSLAYLGLMLHGWSGLAVQFALFVVCRRLARHSRSGLYAVILSAVAGSAIVAFNGVTEYLVHGRAGAWTWRVFSTSTPDFLAGYLVMLLPATLALFASALSRRGQSPVFALLWGFVAVAQFATLVTTGSRFALLSLLASAAVFGLAWRASRHKTGNDVTVNRRALAVAAVCLVLIGLVFAKPVLSRLQNSPANSAAFRVWTWKGAARMAARNPLLGTGVGAWVDMYPPYALTGFTRLAHNSYLQLADECGLPALAALLATLGLAGLAARRGLSATAKQSPGASPLLDAIAPADDRLLQCGLLAGLAAGVVQNLIDSDWYVFFLGVTFWSLAGVAVGLGDRAVGTEAARPLSRLGLLLSGGLAAALLILFGTWGMAAYYNGQAQRESDAIATQLAYAQAEAWDPLNARFPGDLGYRVYARVGNLTAAETSLRAAVALEPNGVNFQRLGAVLEAQDRRGDALAAYQNGLRVDPNKLELLLGAARLSSPAEALDFDRKIASVEDSPVGQVRAIGDVTEVKFAEADAALGQAAAQAGNGTKAAHFYQRAAQVLESYAQEGGTANPQRQILNGFRPNDDVKYRDLYGQVMAGWANAAPAEQKVAVQSRGQDYAMRFRAILSQDHALLGDKALAAGDAAQATLDFSRAAEFLQSYADEGGTHSGQRQGLAASKPDPRLDSDMQALYRHVMDRLRPSRPPNRGRFLATGRGSTTPSSRLCYLSAETGYTPSQISEEESPFHEHHRHQARSAHQESAQTATPAGTRPRFRLRPGPGAAVHRSTRQERRQCSAGRERHEHDYQPDGRGRPEATHRPD